MYHSSGGALGAAAVTPYQSTAKRSARVGSKATGCPLLSSGPLSNRSFSSSQSDPTGSRKEPPYASASHCLAAQGETFVREETNITAFPWLPHPKQLYAV